MEVITYSGDWVLLNAQFYKFWMHIDEFLKFDVNTNFIKVVNK